MAKTTQNFLTYAYRGKVGKQYSLRIRDGRSFIAGLPERGVDRAQSPKQLAAREAFQRAAIYATSAMESATLKEEYNQVRRGSQTAYNVAFQDAYFGPKLSDLRTLEYEGLAGQTMQVQAIDNFRVNKVKFTLLRPDGTKIEEGEAVLKDHNGLQWVYTAQVDNTSVTGTMVRVTAADIPDNQTVMEVIL